MFLGALPVFRSVKTLGVLTSATDHVCSLQDDLERVRIAGKGRVDITVGSALDIFGGKLLYSDVVAWHSKQKQ